MGILKILMINDKNRGEVVSQLHEESKREIEIINTSIFFDSVKEEHVAVVSYY